MRDISSKVKGPYGLVAVMESVFSVISQKLSLVMFFFILHR